MTGAGLAPVMQPCQGDWHMGTLLHRFRKEESGATAIEYGLIAVLVAMTIIASLNAVSGELQGAFDHVSA
jgi:pilus assembly protein Flp/PilA